jgi:phosphatidate cytidylyltransferase
MLARRILTAAVLIALVLAALFVLTPRAFGVALLLVVLIAAHEWANLASLRGALRVLFIGTLAAVGLLLLFGPLGFANGFPDAMVLSICGAATLFWVFVAPPWVVQRWAPRSSIVLALVGWVVLTGAWLALVELKARSPGLVLAAMAIVWIADTAAYFGGRAFGTHKLAPEVSPGKTWEGVYFGVGAVGLYALALAPFAASAGYAAAIDAKGIVLWAAFAAVLAAISVVGDLFESLLKRHAGVKDSGHLLPGHGGVLDRTDALLAAMPPAAVAALLFLRHG